MSQGHPTHPPDTGENIYCPFCCYNLRGIDSLRCPECGREVDRHAIVLGLLPWAHRDHFGALRAYWKTVLLATFNPSRLAQQIDRPVLYRDAQIFRWITIALACIPLWVAMISTSLRERPAKFADQFYCYNSSPDSVPPSSSLACLILGTANPIDWTLDKMSWNDLFVLERGSLALTLLGIVVTLIVLTGMPSYFFHPAALDVPRQNRGVALSYYASAPLAWTVLLSPVGLFAGSLLLWIVLVLDLILVTSITLTLLRRAIAASTERRIAVAVALPATTVVLSATLFLLIHAGVNYIVLAIRSFWP